jgi:hypothetical protein
LKPEDLECSSPACAASGLAQGPRRLEQDLQALLAFSMVPQHLWRKFCRVESMDRIIYPIFSRFNEDWKTHTLKLFTQAA